VVKNGDNSALGPSALVNKVVSDGDYTDAPPSGEQNAVEVL
jgi:hypothetical protein